MRRIFFVCALTIAAAGCSQRRPDTGFEAIQGNAHALTGHDLTWRLGESTACGGQPAQLPGGKQLSLNDAVELALLNNPSLQATYEELGLANADVMQAGIFKNPVIYADGKFPNQPGMGVKSDLSLAFDFIDLILIPLRKKVEGLRFEAAKTRIVSEVVKAVAETDQAWFQLAAEQAKLDARKKLLESAEASAEFAQKLAKSGNMAELSTIPRVAAVHQAKLDLSRQEFEASRAREKLSRLMGVNAAPAAPATPASSVEWSVARRLPELPASDGLPGADEVVAAALQARLDLETQRQEIAVLEKTRGLKAWGVYTAAQLGAASEHEPDHVWLTGPSLQLDLPLFNRGQADRARLEAQLRLTRQKLAAMEADARSEVRELLLRLSTGRAAVDYYLKTVLPLRQRAVDLTLEQYNIMTMSALDLLDAKHEQLLAEIELTDATRDYWQTRVELARATGGNLGRLMNQADAPAPTSGNAGPETQPDPK